MSPIPKPIKVGLSVDIRDKISFILTLEVWLYSHWFWRNSKSFISIL